MTTFKIAIIGAGPAGCMLARLLLQAQAPVSIIIFEGEQSANFRAQGGTLDLHPQSGLAAMKAAGLYEDFLKIARFDGAALVVCDKDAKAYLRLSSTENKNPEVDRSQLRTLLVNSLPEGLVNWGHRLQGVNDNLDLDFGHVVKKGFDMVIGADGGWSKVRKHVSDVVPHYCGITGYKLSITKPEDTAVEASKLVNRGSVFSHAEGKSIVGQQMGDSSIEVNAWRTQDKPDDGKIISRKEICEIYDDWAPELLQLIRAADDDIVVRSLYTLPQDFKWKSRKGVTVLGDAAHLMPPFAGEGVNLAFIDAMKLSQAITSGLEAGGNEALWKAVRTYEEELFQRGSKAQKMTHGMMNDMYHTKGAPRTSIEGWLLKRLSYDLPPLWSPLLYPLLVGAIYTGYFFFKLFN